MADIQIENLIKEVKAGNAINQKLLDQKILDDTPKQLFMNNLFEILNARDLFAKQNEVLDDQPQQVGQQITEPLDKGFTGITGKGNMNNLKFLGINSIELLKTQNRAFKLTAKYQREHLSLLGFGFKLDGQNRNIFNDFLKQFSDESIKRIKDNSKQFAKL